MLTANLKVAANMIRELIAIDKPACLHGSPGVGKSEVIDQVAESIDHAVVDIRASRLDPVDLHGIPVPDLNTRTTDWLIPSMLPDVKRHGPKGILKLDELDKAAPGMQNALLGLILERRLGEYRLPKGWVPVAACNLLKDKAGAMRMSSALSNRFAHIEIIPDVPAWTEWAIKAGINPIMIAFIRFRPELLHKMPDREEIKAFPTPRSLETVSKVLNSTLRLELATSIIGQPTAIELEAFCKMYMDLPTADEIIASPSTARLPNPSKPAQSYALATGLGRMATKETFAPIIEYTNRMMKEFNVMCVTDAVRRTKALTNTKAYAQWVVANQEVTI